ncbi:MAG: PIN domain-containing protein, partial [Olsenella sp.]
MPFPSGGASRAYNVAVSAPNDAIVSDYVVDELKSVYARKFPAKTAALDSFLAALASTVEIVFTPDEAKTEKDETEIRDPTDRPVLRAARHTSADILLTGAYCSFFGVTFRSPSVYRSISHRCVLACGTG